MIGIYKITNLINNKSYIGQSIDIQARFSSHKRTLQWNDPRVNYPLYRDFKKYGLENFSFEIIEQCSKDELNEKEKYWINHYNTYNNGYNLTLGGEGSQLLPQEQIDNIIRLWNEGLSIFQIIKETGYNHKTITRYLKLYTTTYSPEVAKERGKLRRPVIQYDLYDNIVNEFPSIIDASQQCGITEGVIIQSLNHRTRFTRDGFYFIYGDLDRNEELKKQWKLLEDGEKVIQLDKNNNIIHVFRSVLVAAKIFNVPSEYIKRCCDKKRKSAYGYKWIYYSELNKSTEI